MEAVAFHHTPNEVPHEYSDSVSAVHAANLLAHELESSSPEFIVSENDEILASLAAPEEIADWRETAAEMPVLLADEK